VSLSRSALHAFHRTTVALEKEVQTVEAIDHVEYSEWRFATELAAMIERAGKPYAIARARQIVEEAERS
jgi:hypothetical protein